MRQKLITLCPNSFEIAQKKHNFSAWVRLKLLEEVPEVVDKRQFSYHYQCPLCKDYVIEEIRHARDCQKCKYAMVFKGEVIA